MSSMQQFADVEPRFDIASTDSNAADPTPARRYRADTYEAAVALATAELGPGVRVIEANRIRRGGLGGFFATDLGVEIAVSTGVPEPERAVLDARTVVDQRAEFDQRLALDAMADAARTASLRLDYTGDVLELTSGGLDELLANVTAPISDADRPSEQTSTFAQHLAYHAADPYGMVPGSAPSDRWTDADDDRVDLAREAAQAERRDVEAMRSGVRAAAAADELVRDGVRRSIDARSTSLADEVATRAPAGAAIPPAAAAPVEQRSAALADLDELLRSAGVVVPDAAPRPVPPPRATRASAQRRDEPTAPPTDRSAVGPSPVGSSAADVAASAADHLISRLAGLSISGDSCLDSLSTLRIAVTAPDGLTVEVTADLGGRRG